MRIAQTKSKIFQSISATRYLAVTYFSKVGQFTIKWTNGTSRLKNVYIQRLKWKTTVDYQYTIHNFQGNKHHDKNSFGSFAVEEQTMKDPKNFSSSAKYQRPLAGY